MAEQDLSFFAGFLAATGVFFSVGGMVWLTSAVRRLARIRIRLTGVPARGEVIGMDVRSDSHGVTINAPQVRYFLPAGPPVLTRAYGYRNRQFVVTGAQVRIWYDPLCPERILVARVRIWYDPLCPERILVARFDLRPRDLVAFVCAAATAAIGVALEVAAYALA